jgi:antitoxin ParD1/3/4
MATLTLSLSNELNEFVAAQVAAGGYASAEAYVQALLQEARRRKAWEKLEAMALEGLNSGPPLEITEEFWKQLDRDVKKKRPKARKS